MGIAIDGQVVKLQRSPCESDASTAKYFATQGAPAAFYSTTGPLQVDRMGFQQSLGAQLEDITFK